MVAVRSFPHGGVKWLIERCRCDECRRGHDRWKKYRDRARKRYPTNVTDQVDVAARHIRTCSEHGLGYKRVAIIAGVNEDTIRGIRDLNYKTVKVNVLADVEATAKELARTNNTEAPSPLTYPALDAWALVARLEALGMSRKQIAQRVLGRAPSTGGIRFGDVVMRATMVTLQAAVDQAEAGGVGMLECALCGWLLEDHQLASRCPVTQ